MSSSLLGGEPEYDLYSSNTTHIITQYLAHPHCFRSAHANLMKSGTNSKSNSPSNSSAMNNGGVKQSKTFMSVVRRARINQDGSSPFAEYEVSCSLRVSSRKVETERGEKALIEGSGEDD